MAAEHLPDGTEKIQKAKKQAERTAISPQKKSAAKGRQEAEPQCTLSDWDYSDFIHRVSLCAQKRLCGLYRG